MSSTRGTIRSGNGGGSASIIGIGQSAVGRRLGRSAVSLTLDSSLEAIADAGLRPCDIDGLSAYPGGGVGTPGFAGPTLMEVQDALRLELGWYTSGVEVPGQLSPLMHADMALERGLVRNVLVYRTVTEGSARAASRAALTAGNRTTTADGTTTVDDTINTSSNTTNTSDKRPPASFGAEGPMQWLSPYGVASASNWYALHLRRYMHDFGLTRAQLAAFAMSARTKAALNPKAIYREPLTLDEYLGGRLISDPLCLYDCDVPCDGSTAFVVSVRAAALDAPNGGIDIAAFGSAAGPRTFRDQLPDPWFGARAAAQMWAQTDLRPADVDVAQLYDGFSFLALCWLESLGFCERGQGGDFIEGGNRIALDGELPLNTSGGQLAAGRLHGLGLLHEACLQLRGQAGDRQVANAEVAVVANGAVPNMGCMLLTRSR